MKNTIDSMCRNISIIAKKYSTEQTDKDNAMKNPDLSTEGRVNLAKEVENKFYSDVKPYINIIVSDEKVLLKKIVGGNYNPDDVGVNASITLVSKPNVPINVIKDIVNKYNDNNVVLNLLYSVAIDEYKGYFAECLVNQAIIDEAEKALFKLESGFYSSPEELMNCLSKIVDIVKNIIIIKGLDVDVNSGAFADARATIISSMVHY